MQPSLDNKPKNLKFQYILAKNVDLMFSVYQMRFSLELIPFSN